MIVAVHRNFRSGQLLVLTYENKLIQRIQIGADTKATHTVIIPSRLARQWYTSFRGTKLEGVVWRRKERIENLSSCAGSDNDSESLANLGRSRSHRDRCCLNCVTIGDGRNENHSNIVMITQWPNKKL